MWFPDVALRLVPTNAGGDRASAPSMTPVTLDRDGSWDGGAETADRSVESMTRRAEASGADSNDEDPIARGLACSTGVEGTPGVVVLVGCIAIDTL